jgi:mRNA interferase RelE/StbE
MSFIIEYSNEAREDLKGLDGSQRKQVLSAISKVSKNPLPKSEGGMGNALGNKQGNNLTGFCKIKLLALGLRVVYEVKRINKVMKVIVIAIRDDEEVYKIASKRLKAE